MMVIGLQQAPVRDIVKLQIHLHQTNFHPFYILLQMI